MVYMHFKEFLFQIDVEKGNRKWVVITDDIFFMII